MPKAAEAKTEAVKRYKVPVHTTYDWSVTRRDNPVGATLQMEASEEVAEELDSIHAIFPELEIRADLRLCSIRLPVNLESPIFLELQESGENDIKFVSGHKRTCLKHLPAILCKFIIPAKYPNEEPPIVVFENVASWLPNWKLEEIIKDLDRLWDSFKDAVIFSYIDYIKSNCETGFGLFQDKKFIVHDEEKFKYLVEENEREENEIFNNTTFTCEICQSEHKGLQSTRFPDCGDIFCNSCLLHYFKSSIKRGEIKNVHCPSVKCTQLYQEKVKKLHEAAESGRISNFEEFNAKFFEMPLNKSILEGVFATESPSSSSQLIERYQDLHNKTTMESYQSLFPDRVAGCPRSICSKIFLKSNPDFKLAICPKCNFAFCVDCYHSWHGENNPCSSTMKHLPKDIIEAWIDHHGHESHRQSDEDRRICSNITFKYGRRRVALAISDYIAQEQFEELIRSGDAEIVRCPNCAILTQRSDGCNKMTCSKCQVFFCNLCGHRLDKRDPYLHYNDPTSTCYGRLFENLVPGDDA